MYLKFMNNLIKYKKFPSDTFLQRLQGDDCAK